MTKNDLKDGDIVTLRNGDRLLYFDNDFLDLNDDPDNKLRDLNDLNDNMTFNIVNKDDVKNDIVKVQRPTIYDEIFNRQTKKMTIAEICNA